MSGGEFDYIQYRIQTAANDLERCLRKGLILGTYENPKTLEMYADTIALLGEAFNRMDCIDLLESGDIGEDTFLTRINTGQDKLNTELNRDTEERESLFFRFKLFKDIFEEHIHQVTDLDPVNSNIMQELSYRHPSNLEPDVREFFSKNPWIFEVIKERILRYNQKQDTYRPYRHFYLFNEPCVLYVYWLTGNDVNIKENWPVETQLANLILSDFELYSRE